MFSATFYASPVWKIVLVLFAFICGGAGWTCKQGFWKWFGLGVLFGPLTLLYILYAILSKRWAVSRGSARPPG